MKKSNINNTVISSKSDLVYQINNFIHYAENQTRHILSKIKVQISIFIGFLINREEIKRDAKFNTFWREISSGLIDIGCKVSSRSALFEAKRLYSTFKRFTNSIEDNLKIENISIPLKLSKKHLLLIASYCRTESQQDIFIEKVVRHSLNASQLRSQLILGVSSKEKNAVLRIDDLVIKTSYKLTRLNIPDNWNENEIKNHIIKNISIFIKIVLGANWSFLPDQNISIGGRERYLDLVFYNVTMHRYLIIDLKISYRISEIDRAKSQIISYTEAYDSRLDLMFQKKTIGLLLGKAPIDSLFFNSTKTPENIFYSEFRI